jgi:hypothetical protein
VPSADGIASRAVDNLTSYEQEDDSARQAPRRSITKSLNHQKSTDDENAGWKELVKRLPMIHESGIAQSIWTSLTHQDIEQHETSTLVAPLNTHSHQSEHR